jgi:hypothetical protein
MALFWSWLYHCFLTVFCVVGSSTPEGAAGLIPSFNAGTRQQTEFYKAGKKLTNVVLEVLNLQRKEDLTIDLVSNQDFNEEECQRLRQSIKCGFIKTLTVGQLEAKAIALQEVKVNDVSNKLFTDFPVIMLLFCLSEMNTTYRCC